MSQRYLVRGGDELPDEAFGRLLSIGGVGVPPGHALDLERFDQTVKPANGCEAVGYLARRDVRFDCLHSKYLVVVATQLHSSLVWS